MTYFDWTLSALIGFSAVFIAGSATMLTVVYTLRFFRNIRHYADVAESNCNPANWF